jgi:hypothetical protein
LLLFITYIELLDGRWGCFLSQTHLAELLLALLLHLNVVFSPCCHLLLLVPLRLEFGFDELCLYRQISQILLVFVIIKDLSFLYNLKLVILINLRVLRGEFLSLQKLLSM